MHLVKFDKKFSKVFYTFWPKITFVIRKSLFNMHKKGPWKVLRNPWNVLEFCICKSVGTMLPTFLIEITLMHIYSFLNLQELYGSPGVWYRLACGSTYSTGCYVCIVQVSRLSWHLNPLAAKSFNCNFHQLKVVSRWRDPQPQVGENYSDLTNWRYSIACYEQPLFPCHKVGCL